jgi:hypothetical protein
MGGLSVIKLLKHDDAELLEQELNSLGSSAQVLQIYAINQKHFAWVQVTEPKSEKKGKK